MDDLLSLLKSSNSSELPEVLFNAQKLLINLHKEDIRNEKVDNQTIIAGAIQMLSVNYNQTISLQDIADSFDISYENFRKLFKKSVGVSPLQYRLRTKFYYAKRLLTEGDSVKNVASKVGYEDPFIFSKQFKKYVGKSPNSFKKNNGQKK